MGERRLAEIIESVPTGVVMTDGGGRITLVNRQTERLFGYTRDELLDRSVEMLVPGRFAAPHASFRSGFMMAPATRPMGAGRDLFGRRKDGSEFPVEIGLTSLGPTGGSAGDASPAIVATVVDITARKQAEAALAESEARLSTVVENLDEGLILGDAEGTLLHWNRAALAMHGFRSMEEGQRTLFEFESVYELSTLDGARVSFARWPMPRILRGERLGGLELRIRRLDVDWERIFRYGGGMVRDASGRHVVFLTVVDVTEQKAAETALLARTAELQAITDHADEAIVRFDREGRFLFANAAAERFTGKAVGDLLGRTLTDAGIAPGMAEAWEHQFSSVLETGKTVDIENEFDRPHCERWYFHSRLVPERRGPQGRFETLLAVSRNVTEQKRTEAAFRQSEERFRLATSAASVGVFELDIATGHFQWSENARGLLGLGPGPSLRWEEFLALVHPDDRLDLAGALARVREPEASGHFDERARIVRPDGTVRWLSARGDIVSGESGSSPARLVGVVLDVTERERYEAGLIAAREAAEEAARLKSAFLANMSHEIRTPLTAILGFAEVLGDEVEGEQAEFVHLIRQGGQRLMDTLDSVLDLARLESGSLHLDRRSVDLAAAARRAAARYAVQAAERGLRLTLGSPVPVHVDADENAVARVLANLLSNAIKFTATGEVSIRVRQVDAWGEVVVSDTGVGIAPSFLPHLFEAFKQESVGHSRTHEGNGIGLSLTKRLLDQLGGTISVTSEKGVGSTFTIRLPLAR